jgi:acyl carrier protein
MPPTADSGLSVEGVAAAIVRFLNAEIMADANAVAVDDVLAAAGVDSMALLKVLVFLEREYGVWIPDEDLTDEIVASARSLATYVCSLAPA